MPAQPPVLTRTFLLLVAAHFLQALGWSSMILVPLFLDHLGASRATIGTITGVAAIGGLLARPVVGWALDRIGRKPVLYVGTVILCAGMASIGLVDRIGPLIYAVSTTVGIGTATLFTGYFTFASDVVPEARRTEGLALFGISGLVPLVVNPIAGGLGITGPEIRWFLPLMALLIAASAIPLLAIRDRGEGGAHVAPPSPAEVVTALRARPLWPVWWATTVFATLVAVFMAFVTVAAADRGVANPGVVWLTYAGGAVFVRLFGASLPERIGPSWMVPPALGCYIAALVVASSAAGTVGFALAGLLAGLGHGYCFPVLAGQTVTRAPPRLRGSAMSLFTALWDIAKLAFVPVAGLVADATSDATLFAGLGGVALAALVVWAGLELRR